MNEVKEVYEDHIANGFEGAMAKDLLAPYEAGKRSSKLLKMKEFVDGEFKIISIEEGRGKFAGLAAVLVCEMPDNKKTFRASIKCPLKEKKAIFENKDKHIGAFATICYKRLTDDGIPYIPVAKAIRDLAY